MSARMWIGQPKKLPASIALALIPSLPRSHLERLVQTLIDRMDEADGDSDFEGQHDEDDLTTAFFLVDRNDGPGCRISDSDFGVDDEGEMDDDGSASFDPRPLTPIPVRLAWDKGAGR
jgi:hypothetical protein